MGVTVAGEYASALWATVKRDVTVFRTYRMRMASQILAILFTMTTFYYVAKLIRPGVVGPQGDYFAYAVVGIVSLSTLTAALNLTRIVQMELLAGTFERVLVSPLGPLGGVLCLAAFPTAYSMALSAVMLAVAKVIYGFPVRLGGIPPALAVSALATTAFVCIGLLFVAALIAFKSATGSSWVIAGLSILGGSTFQSNCSRAGFSGFRRSSHSRRRLSSSAIRCSGAHRSSRSPWNSSSWLASVHC